MGIWKKNPKTNNTFDDIKHMTKDKINLLHVVGATNNDIQIAVGDYEL